MVAFAAALAFVVAHGFAAGPLHVQVDRFIEAKWDGPKGAAPASDSEFLRRAYLDFAGEIPTPAETRAFLEDAAEGKRAALLERLFADARFPERLAEALHVMLMERRGENDAWRQYLVEACRAGKPWDVIAREMLCPDAADASKAGAAYFATQRLEKNGQQPTDYPGVTRDVGRMFLGVDLQCCQCHNHLTVKSYKQADFNGLFVVWQNAKLEKPAGPNKGPWLSEGALAGKYDFVSVLTGVKGQTGPRVPFGAEVEIPALTGDAIWKIKPDKKKNEPGEPQFSPLRETAERIATAENPWFVRNMANRLWWLLMGRGLVEPLDLHNPANPPSHPELLDLLAREFKAHQLNLKWLLHELALTKTYQRASELPEGREAPAEELFAVAKERPLCSEQLARAFLAATGEWERVSATAKAEPKDDATKFDLKTFQAAFRGAFANAAKEPELTVNPTLRSALFLRNSEPVLWALRPREGNRVARLAAMNDAAAVADELYVAVFSRKPTGEETQEVSEWLDKHAEDRMRAVSDLAWALLSSAEFFSNH